MNLIKEFMVNDGLDMEKIINEYSAYLLKVVSNICGNFLPQEDKEEIIFDVFCTLWNNQKKLDLEKDIKPYMASIAHHLTKKRMTKISKYQVETELEEKEIEDFRIEDLSKLVDNHMTYHKIEEVMQELTEEDYNIFILFYYYSLKTKIIAEKLGISNMKVKTRLHRIRKKLKKELEERGYSI